MKYQVCWNEIGDGDARVWGGFEFLADSVCTRADALRAVELNLADNGIQRFASRRSGSVFGYCVEMDTNDKETAILINHSDAGLIWIELE